MRLANRLEALRRRINARASAAKLELDQLMTKATFAALAPLGLVGALPVPKSFEVDMSGMLGFAEDIFNALFPAFTIVIGISLGIGLVLLIVSSVQKAIRSGS